MAFSVLAGVLTCIVVGLTSYYVWADRYAARGAGRRWSLSSTRGSEASGELAAQLLRAGASIRSWGSALRPGRMLIVATVAIFVVWAYFYARDLGSNPSGFFSDEAEIGWEAAGIWNGRAELTFGPLFYQHFGQKFMGAAPVLATAPFVALMGVSDVAVRMSSTVWMAATLLLLYLGLRRTQTPFALVTVIVLALSPIVIHLSRVNFGHAPTLFVTAASMLLWMRARQTERAGTAIAAGMLAGIAVYGQASFVVAIPIFVTSVCVVEVAFNGRRWREYRPVVVFGFASVLTALPMAYIALTKSEFWVRLREKGGVRTTDDYGILDRFASYPTYFSFDYLFRFGEERAIDRHSVPDAGLFAPYVMILIVVGLIALILTRGDPMKRYVLPFAIMAALYPIPDIISKSPDPIPYTVSVYWAVLTIPFIVGYGLRSIQRWAARRSANWLSASLAGVIGMTAVASGFGFYGGAYADYPVAASDYWGWQYGPRPSIQYFLDHEAEYDEFLLDGDFNGAYVFLDFYIEDPVVRGKTRIGSLQEVDIRRSQLFAVRAENLQKYSERNGPWSRYLAMVEVIHYPDGSVALYLVRLDQDLVREGATPL